MPCEAAEGCLLWNKTILSATEGWDRSKRPFFFFSPVQPFDLILQICGKSPTSGKFQVWLFAQIHFGDIGCFFVHNIFQSSLLLEELFSIMKNNIEQGKI